MSDIIIIAGSNNNNLSLANEFNHYLESKNKQSNIVDLVSLNLPLYTPIEQSRGIPEKIFELFDLFKSAKGFFFVIPEYNGSVPPVVSNLIAWLSVSGNKDWRAAFNSKPAALATHSGGGGDNALMALRAQLSYIGMNTIGRVVKVSSRDPLKRIDLEAVSDLLVESIR